MTTKKKIKELTTSFHASDGDLKTENNTGSSETLGVNTGEKWVTLEWPWETINSELNNLEPGSLPEPGLKETSLVMKMDPTVSKKLNTLTPPSN